MIKKLLPLLLALSAVHARAEFERPLLEGHGLILTTAGGLAAASEQRRASDLFTACGIEDSSGAARPAADVVRAVNACLERNFGGRAKAEAGIVDCGFRGSRVCATVEITVTADARGKAAEDAVRASLQSAARVRPGALLGFTVFVRASR